MFADAEGASEFFLLFDFLLRDRAFVGLERILPQLEFAAKVFDIAAIIVRRHEFILAARKEFHEVFEELAGFLQAPEMFQLELPDIPAKQDFVIKFVERLDAFVRGAEDFVEAELVEGAEPDRFGAFAQRFYDPMFHLAGGFVGKREPQDVFASEIRIGLEKITNALSNDASLAGSGTRHHEERTVTMLDGGALLGIQREGRCGSFGRIG